MINDSIFTHKRHSVLDLDEVYFWTDTIKDWKHLMKPDKYKEIICDSLRTLHNNKKIAVYGFVIMPNHLHLLWEMLAMNGREKPYVSFNKETAHNITKDLKVYHPLVLDKFKAEETEREYRIWKRFPKGIVMDNKKKFEQKLDYIHNNPLQAHWNLAVSTEEYKWSSASFYDTGIDHFGFLTHYMKQFG